MCVFAYNFVHICYFVFYLLRNTMHICLFSRQKCESSQCIYYYRTDDSTGKEAANNETNKNLNHIIVYK
jgi:hypothetical protein